MKVMVEGHVPAWCYVDTTSREVELIEVWAWDEEFSLPNRPFVMSEDGGEDDLLTPAVRKRAIEIASERAAEAEFCVVASSDSTRLERRPAPPSL